jgi:hypothetical protein
MINYVQGHDTHSRLLLMDTDHSLPDWSLRVCLVMTMTTNKSYEIFLYIAKSLEYLKGFGDINIFINVYKYNIFRGKPTFDSISPP